MTQLKCSVRNCMYNDEQLCSKGDITIGGHEAKRPNETCCESFRERSDRMTNAVVGHPSKNISVRCQATNCGFNENCRCSAEEIGIAGSNACSCGETECASFDCHCK